MTIVNIMSTDAPRNLLYESCRLCLEKAGAYNLFEPDDLLTDVFNCTGIRVSRLDNLPHKICSLCFEIVKNSRELRLLASKNDAHLRYLFGQEDSDTDTVILEPCNPITTPEIIDLTEDSPEKTYISSKEKISFLLKEGEKDDTEAAPEITQPISMRKDLFPPLRSSSPAAPEITQPIYMRKDLFPPLRSSSPGPVKTVSSIKEDPDEKLIKVKVDTENRCKRVKTDVKDEVVFSCRVCHKKFDKSKKLYHHQRRHDKKICCPLDACGKKFATKGDLKKHTRTHTGEKPYKCKQCSKCFAQQVTLKQHVSCVHSGGIATDKED